MEEGTMVDVRAFNPVSRRPFDKVIAKHITLPDVKTGHVRRFSAKGLIASWYLSNTNTNTNNLAEIMSIGRIVQRLSMTARVTQATRFANFVPPPIVAFSALLNLGGHHQLSVGSASEINYIRTLAELMFH